MGARLAIEEEMPAPEYAGYKGSTIQPVHSHRIVPFAGRDTRRKLMVDSRQVVRSQRNSDGNDIFLEVGAPLGAGNRDNVASLRQKPGESQLRGRAFFLGGNFFD